jgi:hypothetical protein
VRTSSHPPLQHVVAALQRRWGPNALQRLSQLRERGFLPTGWDALDQVLSGGGVPCGGITHLSGQPTSGMVTLAFQITARALAEGYGAVAIDLTRSLDLDYARRCGVVLDQLALVWPPSPRIGIEIARDIVAQDIAAVIVFDATAVDAAWDDPEMLVRSLRRLKAALVDTPCIVLCLTGTSNHPCATAINSVAALGLAVEHVTWLHETQDVVGYRAQITVRKDQRGSPGRSAAISVRLEETSHP